MVSDLFLVTGAWDVRKLEPLFLLVDSAQNLSIPLGNNTHSLDKWIWHFEAKGMYCVQGGYNGLLQHSCWLKVPATQALLDGRELHENYQCLLR